MIVNYQLKLSKKNTRKESIKTIWETVLNYRTTVCSSVLTISHFQYLTCWPPVFVSLTRIFQLFGLVKFNFSLEKYFYYYLTYSSDNLRVCIKECCTILSNEVSLGKCEWIKLWPFILFSLCEAKYKHFKQSSVQFGEIGPYIFEFSCNNSLLPICDANIKYTATWIYATT